MQEQWKAIRWTCHAATTVVVDDPSRPSGVRVIAECETKEDASRIVACVNACSGVEDPSMYPMAKMLKLADEQRAACFELERHRDALLAALCVAEKFVSKFEEDDDYTDGQVETISAIRSAIAKATGTTN